MYIETVVVIKIIKIAMRDGIADVGERFGWTSHGVSSGAGQGARWKNKYETSKRRDNGDASVSARMRSGDEELGSNIQVTSM
jgi:hypothetical protein